MAISALWNKILLYCFPGGGFSSHPSSISPPDLCFRAHQSKGTMGRCAEQPNRQSEAHDIPHRCVASAESDAASLAGSPREASAAFAAGSTCFLECPHSPQFRSSPHTATIASASCSALLTACMPLM